MWAMAVADSWGFRASKLWPPYRPPYALFSFLSAHDMTFPMTLSLPYRRISSSWAWDMAWIAYNAISFLPSLPGLSRRYFPLFGGYVKVVSATSTIWTTNSSMSLNSRTRSTTNRCRFEWPSFCHCSRTTVLDMLEYNDHRTYMFFLGGLRIDAHRRRSPMNLPQKSSPPC